MSRDYKDEYRKFQSSDAEIARRSARNKSRRRLEKEGRVHKGDGKDVDHKDHNPHNRENDNLRVISQATNRADNR